MDLKGILSISGFPGLFKLVAHSRNGIIVESLKDKKRMQAFATSKISALEDIAIYTESGDMPLVDVLKNIYEFKQGEQLAKVKSMSSEQLKNLFNDIVPEYDKERVYVSDMKRVFNWYNLLMELDLLDFTEDEDKNEETSKENIDSKEVETDNKEKNNNKEEE